jgi:hypothetical protein
LESPRPKIVNFKPDNKSFARVRFFIALQKESAFSGASPFPVVEQTIGEGERKREKGDD